MLHQRRPAKPCHVLIERRISSINFARFSACRILCVHVNVSVRMLLYFICFLYPGLSKQIIFEQTRKSIHITKKHIYYVKQLPVPHKRKRFKSILLSLLYVKCEWNVRKRDNTMVGCLLLSVAQNYIYTHKMYRNVRRQCLQNVSVPYICTLRWKRDR